MWLRLFGSLALVTSLVVPAEATTSIRSVNGVEIIVSERDAVAPAHAKTRPLRHVAHAYQKPAIRRQPARVVIAAAPELRGAQSLIGAALGYLGTPYVWGGAAPGGFDCSGFTYYAYARLGIGIPRTADLQFAAGRPVVGDPLPGDLVFFQTYDYGASHVGMYLGNGRFVNAIRPDVHVATFASEYFRSRYLGARRFLPG